MARDVRYIKKEDNPSQEEIVAAKALFKKQLFKNNYDFSRWVLHFDVGDVFKEIYKARNNEKEHNPLGITTIYTFEEDVDFRETRFEVGTSFGYASFRGKANFWSASFIEYAIFKYAGFTNEADFSFAVFKKEADFKHASFIEEASFNDVSFVGVALFSNVSFTKKTNFDYANFEEKSYFNSTFFKSVAYFRESSFVGKSDFRFSTFVGIAYFSPTKFESVAAFSNASFKKESCFKSASFRESTFFWSVCFDGKADFESSEFSGSSSFLSTTFGAASSFKSSIFERNADFKDTIFVKEACFIGTSFEKQTIFRATLFRERVLFRDAKFIGDAHFESSCFRAEVSFCSAHFGAVSHFTHASFEKEAIFMNATFVELAKFNSSKFSKVASISFQKTSFNARLYFEDCNIRDENENKVKTHREKHGIIEFDRASFHGTASFTGSSFKELVFEDCLYEKQIFLPNEEDIANPNREFFCLAKHEALKVNNQIKAHEFYVKEMQAYRDEINTRRKDKRKLKRDNIIRFNLWLNEKSTYYGSNWWQGVFFIFHVSVVGFVPYISDVLDTEMEIDLYGLPDNLYTFVLLCKGYFAYLNDMLTFGFSKEFFGDDGTKGFAIENIVPLNMLFRIFIGYGVYQTVAAFRRLGKF